MLRIRMHGPSAGAVLSQGRPTQQWICKQPQASWGLVFFYWVIFIFVVALVMLSLFVGAITLGMQQSMDEASFGTRPAPSPHLLVV